MDTLDKNNTPDGLSDGEKALRHFQQLALTFSHAIAENDNETASRLSHYFYHFFQRQTESHYQQDQTSGQYTFHILWYLTHKKTIDEAGGTTNCAFQKVQHSREWEKGVRQENGSTVIPYPKGLSPFVAKAMGDRLLEVTQTRIANRTNINNI